MTAGRGSRTRDAGGTSGTEAAAPRRRAPGDGGPAIAIAPDVRFFVLDDGGVLFSETRQELFSFNTAAAFIWCALEEGLERAEIAARLAAVNAGTRDEAERTVNDLVQQWQGCGFVSGFTHPCPPEIDFTTALGRLLASPALRRAFAASPAATADHLAVRAADRDAFLSLDPRGLEAQARLVDARLRAAREKPTTRGDAATTSALERLRTGDWSSFAVRHTYRLLGTAFEVRFQSPAQEAWVRPVLAHLETDAPTRVDATIDLVEEAHGHLVLEYGVPVAHCPRLDQIAPVVKSSLRQISVNRHTYFLKIHAGVVSGGNGCLLLPAAPGSGKTVLTAALVAAGFDYFSDEIALLDEGTLAVRPMPLGMTVKPGAIDVLGRFFPGVGDLPAHVREDAQVVRYLDPPPGGGAAPDGPQPVRWIVFPTYVRESETVLEPIGRTEGLSRLMQELMVLPADLDTPKVADLVRWVREVAWFRLAVSSLSDAVGLIQALCREVPGGR